MKKILALLLAVVTVLAMFTACAKTENTPTNDTPATNESNDAPATNEETPATNEEAPASDDLFAEEVTLHWVIPAAADSYPGWEEILEKVNEITKAKINATVEAELIPLGEYTDKMNMKFSAGEEFDLCFTGAWNPYLPAVSKGAYAELSEDVLNTYAPDVMAELNSGAWDAVRVGGKVYGIPLQQIYVRQTGVRFVTDILNTLDYDVSSINTLDDLDGYLAAVAELNEGYDCVMFNSEQYVYDTLVNYLGYDVLVSNKTPGVVYYNAETPVAINQFASEEFKQMCYKTKEWQEKGYFPADAITGADSVADYGVKAVDFDTAFKPGGVISESANRGYDLTEIPFGDCAMTTGAIQATITAVSATSKNVERAVAFINLLDSDEELLNLVCHGIEGRDWQFVGDPADRVIESISDYPGMYSFLIGNVFNEYYTDPTQVGTWEETAEINATAKSSCALGFAFDSEPVSTQIAQCTAVVDEYLPSLNCGLVDDVDAAIAEFNAALEQAGVNDILTEMQSQLDAWLATK